MARGNPLRRLVELVLDKRGTRKFERDGQKALKKGTDPKKATKNLSAVDRAFAKLRKRALQLGGALAAAFAIRGIARFGKEAIRVASEAGAIWTRLEGQLANVGVRMAEVRGEIDRTFRDIQDRTILGDEDAARVLTELVSATGDYALSLRHVEDVADLAAAKQIDLNTAAKLYGRVLVGDTALLKRYGIIVEEGADAVEAMRARFAGMSENEAKTLAGRVKQLNNEWGDFKQAVGDAMIESGGGTSIIETMTGALKGLTIWLNTNRGEIARWARFSVGAIRSVWTVLSSGIGIAVDVGDGVFRAVMAGLHKLAEGAGRALNWIPGINIDVEHHSRQASRHMIGLGAAIKGVGGHLGNLAGMWVNVAEAATVAARAQDDAVAAGGGGGKGRAGLPTPKVGLVNSGANRVAAARDAVVMDAGAREKAREAMEMLTAEYRNGFADIESAAGNAAYGVAGAFQDAFSLMFQDMENLAEAGEALFRGLGGAAMGAVADWASAKMAESVASAFSATAEGLMFAARGDPRAAAAFASAKTHGVAAAKWAVLAGAAGAGQSAVAGGGRGGVSGGIPSGARDANGRTLDEVRGPETHIHLHGDFDALNPRVQEVVHVAGELGRQAFGGNVKVTHHRRRS